jgi:hypothetical protein
MPHSGGDLLTSIKRLLETIELLSINSLISGKRDRFQTAKTEGKGMQGHRPEI